MTDGPGASDMAGRLDALAEPEARRALAGCCASPRWVEAMLALRPFGQDRALLEAAERFWWSLPEEEWLAAFAAHPRIGDPSPADERSRAEQAGVAGADAAVLEALEAGNRAYEEKFGFVFLVCATGKDAPGMLAALEARLARDRDAELETAAAEQAKITALRLARLGEGSEPRRSGARATGDTRDSGRESTMGISTHVLDTTRGRPAAGVRVALERRADGAWQPLYAGETDGDGRTGDLCVEPPPGAYRLRFDTGRYFEATGVVAFHPVVEVTFTVDDPSAHYHVPLLLSPFGYTTYRGS